MSAATIDIGVNGTEKVVISIITFFSRSYLEDGCKINIQNCGHKQSFSISAAASQLQEPGTQSTLDIKVNDGGLVVISFTSSSLLCFVDTFEVTSCKLTLQLNRGIPITFSLPTTPSAPPVTSNSHSSLLTYESAQLPTTTLARKGFHLHCGGQENRGRYHF